MNPTGGLSSNFNASFTPSASPLPGIQKTYGDLESGYSGAINAQPTVPQLTSKYNDQFNVPRLQQQVQQGNATSDMLGNQINAVPKDIQQGSQESILTQGQLSRMTQARQTPLLQEKNMVDQNLTRTGQNLGVAQSNANQMVTAEQAQQAKQLQPWLQQFSDEAVIAAHQMTGWTTQNAQELQVLLANQQAGVQQSEGEKNRMNQLAMQESQFHQQLQLQQDQQKFQSTQGSNPFVSLSEGNTLFNTTSGQPVYTAPKSYAPGTGGTWG